jgi:hypothetical protein
MARSLDGYSMLTTVPPTSIALDAPETVLEPERLEGEGPVAGFVLELESIWASL